MIKKLKNKIEMYECEYKLLMEKGLVHGALNAKADAIDAKEALSAREKAVADWCARKHNVMAD